MTSPPAEWTASGPGWRHLRRPRPDLAGHSPAELLSLSAELPGNLRYGTGPGGVFLLGEVCGHHDLDTPLPTFAEVGEDELEAALDATGWPWRRRDDSWALPAGGRLPREVCLTCEGGGVLVEALLVGPDEVAEAGPALAAFLCRAQLGLRFARCEQVGRQVRLASRVEGPGLEQALPHAVGGVVAGLQVLAGEARALLLPELAEAYLRFFAAPAVKEHVPIP
jgi:hypothetical protein